MLYQKRREAPGEYRFTVPNGTYQVRLKFAEFDVSKVGDRKMTIRLRAQPSRPRWTSTPWQENTALDRTYQITVSDGILNIAFIKNGGKKTRLCRPSK